MSKRKDIINYLVEYYPYVQVGDIDMIKGYTNDKYPCYIIKDVYFTHDEYCKLLENVKTEYRKRHNINIQGTTSKAHHDKLKNKQYEL